MPGNTWAAIALVILSITASGCASGPERTAASEPSSKTEQAESSESPKPSYADWAKANHLREIDERADRIRGELEALGTAANEETIRRRQILERELEIARLERQIVQELDKFTTRPRRIFVGARSDSAAIRSYLDVWQAHLETLGTKNMLPGAYGKVQLTMAIRPDGTLETVEINRSSGNIALDESAKRIARLGAPYPQFLKGMEAIDVLHITRTWTFEKRGSNPLE